MEVKRLIAFTSLVGSHNYNLNTMKSDKDYKIFVYPNIRDIYNGVRLSSQSSEDGVDITYHDVRMLEELFRKSNPSNIEVLFTEEVINKDKLFEDLVEYREEIASMNLTYLYNSTLGMMRRQEKRIERGMREDNTEDIRKSVTNFLRLGMLLDRYHTNGFSDFKSAIYYRTGSPMHTYLKGIKEGEVPLSEVTKRIDTVKKYSIELADVYQQPINEDMLTKLHDIIYEHTLDKIRKMI